MQDLDDLVKGWILEHSSSNISLPDEERTTEYWEMLDDLVRKDPKQAWTAILCMLKETQDEMIVSNIAAGPLEKLVARHGETMIDQIEVEARQSARLRHALRGIWKNRSSDAVWERVEQVRNIS